jgi:3-oxoacyl-[acyl-carrier protein] reductase
MTTEKKVAIVTGASKGIGVGIAKALAAESYAVVVNYREDIAPLAVFLASDKASWITGEVIAASGGL